MVLYQHGLLALDAKIASDDLLGPDFAVHGKQDITVLNLLLHNAGGCTLLAGKALSPAVSLFLQTIEY